MPAEKESRELFSCVTLFFLNSCICLILNSTNLKICPKQMKWFVEGSHQRANEILHIIVTASDRVVLAFFVPPLFFKTRHLGSWPSCSQSAAYEHYTQVGASSYQFTINQSIPPTRPLFNLYLFSPFPLSPTFLQPFERGRTMDGNESNAHCAPCAGRKWLADWREWLQNPLSSHFSHEWTQSLMARSLPSTALLTIYSDFLVFVTAKRAIQQA